MVAGIAAAMPTNLEADYSATPTCLMPPFGPGLCLAHRSSSVIGTVMQNVPGAQGPHGELTELSVTGAQELVAAAAEVVELARDSKSLIATSLHGATVGAGMATALGSSTYLSDATA